MTPLISIVTTVYDRTGCLATCLRSVARLAYRPIEHIVVSDCPPEPVVSEIRDLCHAAGARHLNLAQRTNNWGLAPAMTGLRAATGTYVCFLSDDNAYLPDHFGPLVEALEADPGLGFVYSSCQYAGRLVLRSSTPRCTEIDLGQPLFRRSVLQGQRVGARLCWDWLLISWLMRRGVRWKHVDRATFLFRAEAYPEYLEAFA